MAVAHPSRFACLKIEDDDFQPANASKSKDKKKSDPKPNGGKKNDKSAALLKPLSKTQMKKERRRQKDVWEEWKKIDAEYMNENYEQDLHTAILESKLDFEKKHVHKKNKKDAGAAPATADGEKKSEVNGKKKKNKAMSLEQFNHLVDGNQESAGAKGDADNEFSSSPVNDDQFFERIKTETKEELTKEFSKEQKKEMKKSRKSFNNDTITIAHLQEKLEKLEKDNASLRAELDKSKLEVYTVKLRNQSLCQIIALGEMKDKASVLQELQELKSIRIDLTDEVTRLNVLLEQERSKVGALTAGETHTHKQHKEKNKKRTASETNQQ